MSLFWSINHQLNNCEMNKYQSCANNEPSAKLTYNLVSFSLLGDFTRFNVPLHFEQVKYALSKTEVARTNREIKISSVVQGFYFA